jgi:SAM-dependent methyltransferase
MQQDSFDSIASAYEAMIDWPKRLANEEPFFRWIFDQVQARSVLDVACGTGHHANLFRTWNLRVEGADLSETMISHCKQQWGESGTHRWSVRRFDQPVDTPASFDVVICTGNSLALADDSTQVTLALQQMLDAAREGGAVVVQVLNLWKLPDGECIWQKCKRTPLPKGQSLIIKGVHRCGMRGYVDLLITNLESDPPDFQARSAPFLGLEANDLGMIATRAGAKTIEAYGGYDRSAYDRHTSQDLILVIRK